MKSKYEDTVGGRCGPGLKDDKEISVLNRIIRWTPNGSNTRRTHAKLRSCSERSSVREPMR